MAMDAHSKNVCLIGILHIILYFLFLEDGYNNIKYRDLNDLWFREDVSFAAYSVTMAFLAALMIYGVIKKRHIFLAPFLAMNILYLCVLIFTILQDLYYGAGVPAFFSRSQGYKLGATLMTIYPIETLFIKLHSQHQAATPTKASMSLVV